MMIQVSPEHISRLWIIRHLEIWYLGALNIVPAVLGSQQLSCAASQRVKLIPAGEPTQGWIRCEEPVGSLDLTGSIIGETYLQGPSGCDVVM